MPRNLKISQEEANHLTIEGQGHCVPFQSLEPESGIYWIYKDWLRRAKGSWNLKPETWHSQLETWLKPILAQMYYQLYSLTF